MIDSLKIWIGTSGFFIILKTGVFDTLCKLGIWPRKREAMLKNTNLTKIHL